MEALTLTSRIGLPIEIDACWSCQMIWFDNMESSALSPDSVVELFKRIHAGRDRPRNIVSMRMACPRCATPLALTQDLGRGGHFSYYRCQNGDGRLTSFTQFLREKNFVRTLNPAEIQSLSVKVSQIRCSSCGAPVDLQKDSACTHCGSPISVLDADAVDKALKEYEVRAQTRPRPLNPMPTYPGASVPAPWGDWSGAGSNNVEWGGALVDLIGDGIAALFD
jgi:hypothetical protein